MRDGRDIQRKRSIYKIVMAESRLNKKKRRVKSKSTYVPGKKLTYRVYITSKRWYLKRDQLWNERIHVCGTCRCLLDEFTSALHHRTYLRMGDEQNNDLVFLCHNCHEQIHFYQNGKKKSLHPISLAKEERLLRDYYINHPLTDIV